MNVPILLLVLLFSIIVHECAHGLTAERFGDSTARELGRLTLNPLVHIDPVGTILIPAILVLSNSPVMFGWAKPVPINGARLRDPDRQYPLIAAAGPASNLLLAAASAVLLGFVVGLGGMPAGLFPGSGSVADGSTFLYWLFMYGIQINVLLALFNLIPLPPLDGSWIVRRFLGGGALDFYERIRPFGFPLLIILLMLGLRDVLRVAVFTVSDWFAAISNAIISILR